ncbi:hypothetical protein JO83_08005 [Avibacterium paragallinarum]|uniref:DUF4065 domain-containing protein n=1 Tax=Avibacterium paragallinarum TaxID=728 RepID=A0A8B3T989_AVIPA|nr:type II toxin-antitoxin system antitoxin SocA domain-containing protein [Avibacterium paragallinarum]RZN53545.1 DUF4065 domain-containing protein [Avibacterium paragallinarum]TID21086.1 hypothetical protein JO83_08005 [Avibacterium paragallinarum]
MAYSAMQVANAFIEKAQEGKITNLTPMKLQKLMFFAQSWYIKKFQARLIDDNFMRWPYGPVIPSVYYEFSGNGGDEITAPARNAYNTPFPERLNDHDDQFLDEIIDVYGSFNGWTLSDMTHQNGTAWKMRPIGTVITDQELFDGRV